MSYNYLKTKFNSEYLKCIRNNCKKDMQNVTLYDKELKRYLKTLKKKKSDIKSSIIDELRNDKYLKKLSNKLAKCSNKKCLKEKKVFMQRIVKDINNRMKTKKRKPNSNHSIIKNNSKTPNLSHKKLTSNDMHKINNIKKHFHRYEKELNELDRQIGETKHVLHNLKKSLKRTLKQISN